MKKYEYSVIVFGDGADDETNEKTFEKWGGFCCDPDENIVEAETKEEAESLALQTVKKLIKKHHKTYLIEENAFDANEPDGKKSLCVFRKGYVSKWDDPTYTITHNGKTYGMYAQIIVDDVGEYIPPKPVEKKPKPDWKTMGKAELIAEIKKTPSYDGADLNDKEIKELQRLLRKYRTIPQNESELVKEAHLHSNNLYIAVSAKPFGEKCEDGIITEIYPVRRKKIEYHYNALKKEYAKKDYYIGAFDEKDGDLDGKLYSNPFYWEKTKED